MLETHACLQSRNRRANPCDSEFLIDHVIHNKYQRPLDFGVIKTYITDRFATYFEMSIDSLVRSQHFRWDRPFLRDGNAKNFYSIHLNPCLELEHLGQDINTSTESFANAISKAAKAFTSEPLSKLLDTLEP